MPNTLLRFLVAFVFALSLLGAAQYGLCQNEGETAVSEADTATLETELPSETDAEGYEIAEAVDETDIEEDTYPTGPARDEELYGILEGAKQAIRDGDTEGGRAQLKELVTRCSDLGITSYEALSAALVKEAQALLDKNDLAGATLLFDTAVTISPNYPPAYFAKGWGLFSQKKFKLLLASDSFIEGITHSIKDFWWSFNYLGNKATSLLFTLAALFTIFGLFAAVRYTPLLAHDLAEKLGREGLESLFKFVILPGVFTAALLILGYWWAVTIVLLSLWAYFNKREKILSVLFFLLLVFMPVIMTKYANFVQGGGNTMLWVIDEVNKGRLQPGTEEFLKDEISRDPENKQANMTLAQMYVKQRRYNEALGLYEALVAAEPSSPIYRNNLANVYFILGQSEKALEEYKAAIEYGPQEALPHFNLSQTYGEMLMFTERSDEDRTASRLDPDMVTSLRAKEGDTLRSLVFDYPTPIKMIWMKALEDSPGSKDFASSLWSTTVKIMPLEGTTFAGIGFIVLVLALNSFRKSKTYSHFCEKCGKVSCKKCQKPVYSSTLCAQCHQIFVKLEGVEARDRLKKTLEIRSKETREGLIFRISSLLFPGSGHYLIGRPIRGFIFSGIFVFLVKDIFFGSFLDTPYSFALNVIMPDTLVLGLLLVLFYIITQTDIYRLTKK